MIALSIIISYIYGSIPFGLLIGKLWKKIDVRTLGSKNIGATNILRTLGPGPAALSLIGDVSKGVLAVLLGRIAGGETLSVICGIIAITGHNWSVFLKFSGGRGISTTLGVYIMLMPKEALIGVIIWGIVLLLTRYVSLGSIIAISTGPFLSWFFGEPLPYILYTVVVAVFGVYKHRANISRLISGKEFKIGEKVGR